MAMMGRGRGGNMGSRRRVEVEPGIAYETCDPEPADQRTKDALADLARAAARRMKATPQFGQMVVNTMASFSNPLRAGRFVKVVRRRHGLMNPGTWWELTDGGGRFWQVRPENCEVE